MTAMWIFLLVLLVGVGVFVWALTTRANGGHARDILAERLARGDLTPEQYRENLALIGGSRVTRRSWLSLAVALLVVGLIGSVAAAGIAMARGDMGWMMGDSNHMNMMGRMMGGDSGRIGDAPRSGATQRTVSAFDFRFDPTTIRIPVAERVNVSLRNEGGSFHTFTVGGVDFELRAQGGEDISGSLRASKPGTYKAICTVPGHERMGMRATVIVEE